jgi:KaiC/GvpD/RAD55 family RecA-like ATPase
MASDLVATGIQGLDFILGGGLMPGSTCLITGAPGTGKSVLCLQFIVEGARRYDEPGIYITVEEKADDIRDYARRLRLDLGDLEGREMLTILEQPVLRGSVLSAEFIGKLVETKRIKRVVLDSLTLFKYLHQGDQVRLRSDILSFLNRMRELGVTLLVTSERDTTNLDYVQYKETDYLFQGIIILLKPRLKSSFERCLTIAKMRGMNHSLNIHSFTIGDGGIAVQHEPSFAHDGDD